MFYTVLVFKKKSNFKLYISNCMHATKVFVKTSIYFKKLFKTLILVKN